MDETRIDGLESQFAELNAEVRNSQRSVDARLCKIEGRLDQTATKVDLSELRAEMYKANAEMKTWILATMVTVIGTVLAALFGLHHWGG